MKKRVFQVSNLFPSTSDEKEVAEMQKNKIYKFRFTPSFIFLVKLENWTRKIKKNK